MKHIYIKIFCFFTFILQTNITASGQMTFVVQNDKDVKEDARSKTPSICGTPSLAELIAEDSRNLAIIESNFESFLQSSMVRKSAINNCIVIPVVIHKIVENASSNENVTSQEIDAALMRLNEDFRGITAANNTLTHPNLTGAFTDKDDHPTIMFKLAEIDPNGNQFSGITETESPLSSVGIFNSSDCGENEFANVAAAENVSIETPAQDLIFWDSQKYLNIYIFDQLHVDWNVYSNCTSL